MTYRRQVPSATFGGTRIREQQDSEQADDDEHEADRDPEIREQRERRDPPGWSALVCVTLVPEVLRCEVATGPFDELHAADCRRPLD